MTAMYQNFRSGSRTVRIPAAQHPTTGEPFLIWSDIKDCFPGVVRIQHEDVFVPMIRNDHLYRLRPHGIKYYPGVTLDVIYDHPVRTVQRAGLVRHVVSRPGESATTTALPALSTPQSTSHHSSGSPSLCSPTLSFRKASTSEMADDSITHALGNSNLPPEAALNRVNPSFEQGPDPTHDSASKVSGMNTPLPMEDIASALAPLPIDKLISDQSRQVNDYQTNGTEIISENYEQPSELVSGPNMQNLPDGTPENVNATAIHSYGNEDGVGEPLSGVQMDGHASSKAAGIDGPESQPSGQAVKNGRTIAAPRVRNGGNAPPTGASPQPDKRHTSQTIQGRHKQFSIQDIVAHRAKDILSKRYDWLDSPCSKLFIIVPRKDEVNSVADIKTMTWHDFDMYFLCDCGEIPGLDQGEHPCYPHVDINGQGHVLQNEATAYGPYMMAILEMLEYGVTIDGVLKVPALTDLNSRKKVMYSMAFLMMQGVEASHQVHARENISSLDEIKPVTPLTGKELMDMHRTCTGLRRPTGSSTATFRTPEGDIRWLCSNHWTKITVWDDIEHAVQFSSHQDSRSYSFNTTLGSIQVTLMTPARAKDFYRLAKVLTTLPVVNLFLDWDLSEGDELELQQAIQSMSAACVKVQVREREEDEEDEMIPGFGHGYFGVIIAALNNKRIQAFSIEKRILDDKLSNRDEFFTFSRSMYLDPILAQFTRDSVTSKVEMGLFVTDLNKAAASIRTGLRGFHSLSKLIMEVTYWEHVKIEFCVDGEGIGDLEDTDYNMDPEMTIFNMRGHDAITLRTYLSADSVFLLTHGLKDANIRVVLPDDGPRIRELIKNNQRLENLELAIDVKDDPCQVFEYFKSLLANHPSLVSFLLRKDRPKTTGSSFAWHGVSDRSKMKLMIQSYAEDKIGPLLQKFGACLTRLILHSMNSQDSAILEKVTRSRKGQMKLVSIGICDVCQMTQPAMDDLAKILLRNNFQQVSISGIMVIRSVTRVADFLTMIAPKITEINIYGEYTKAFIAEMAKRMPDSSAMSSLLELRLSGPLDATTKDLTWYRSMLSKEPPLSKIELQKINLSHQGWMTIAQEVNFAQLKYFRVAPDVPLKVEAIDAFVKAIPADCGLENFHLDSDGQNEARCRFYKAFVMKKLKSKSALVSIGRYF